MELCFVTEQSQTDGCATVEQCAVCHFTSNCSILFASECVGSVGQGLSLEKDTFLLKKKFKFVT